MRTTLFSASLIQSLGYSELTGQSFRVLSTGIQEYSMSVLSAGVLNVAAYPPFPGLAEYDD
jgi:hypothetical protein